MNAEIEAKYLTPGSIAHLEKLSGYIARGLDEGIHPVDIAWAIWDEEIANQSITRDTRTRLLRECGYEPICWICSLRIYLDAAKNDDASLSLDHVVPKMDGGTRNNNNIRLAHNLCNGLRHSTQIKPRTKKRLEQMKRNLRDRMALETTTG